MEEADGTRSKTLPELLQGLIETNSESLTHANSWLDDLDLRTPTQIKPNGGKHIDSLPPFQTVERQLQRAEGMKIGQEEEEEAAAATAAQEQSRDRRMKEKMTGVQRVRVVKGGAPHQGNLQVGHLLFLLW